MLGGMRLKVGFTHEKTCFAYVNAKYSNNSEQSQCVQALFKDRQVYLWVVFSGNIPEGQMLCNPMFSRQIGLEEGADVFVSPYGDVRVLEELYVDTDSPDDQEILEHNAELLQLRILDQLRFVVANQKAVVWISVSLPIVFTPKQTGLLVNHSRIVVEVDVFNSFHKKLHSPKTPEKEKHDVPFQNIGIINDGMLKPYLHPPQQLVLRSITVDSDGKKDLIHPYTVFIHEDLIDEEYKKSVILATLQNIPSIIQTSTNEEREDASICDVCVEIVPINTIVYRSLCQEVYNEHIKTVVIPKALNSIIKLENGTKVILTIIGDKVEHPDHIKVVIYSEDNISDIEVIDKFKTCVIENTQLGKKFLINNNLVKQNHHITSGFVQFQLKPEKLKYTMLNSESFRYCTVSAQCLREKDLKEPKPIVKSIDYRSNIFCRNVKCFEKLVQRVLLNLYFEIHREARFRGVSEIKSNVLITGGSGTGKSAICQIVQQDLTVWSHILHCRTLKGRKDIPEALSKAILMCQEHSPAVLICDDVDSLVPPNMEGGSPQDIAYYQRLASVIKSLLQSCAGVAVMLTATGAGTLHPILKQFTGKPLFTAQLQVPELVQEDRAELFKHLINERIRSEFLVEDDDVTRMALETGGLNVRDITDHLNKKIFAAFKKKKSSKVDGKVRLLEESKPKEEKEKTLDVWAPLGGMHDVKQEITECIFWPIMYPALFPSQSCGILLYGPPGTGKSYIGSCLAACAQFNFIAVKGPELLSKYIGQSEKAVRDVFDKAEMKRPCILFFDEFDSLAPKRGHDSTGVTDRVVNQLLARLDGAEGGASGPVVAATSRPDLIDPALLRAGRLERHVYCAPLDRDDRVEVLRTLAKDVSISPDVDLEAVADSTEGFSPADLKSLLVTAQLTSLEDQLLSKAEDKNMESVVVSCEDLESALMETKPSLTKEQMLYYDMIYKRFRGDKLTDTERMIAARQSRQRVTLA